MSFCYKHTKHYSVVNCNKCGRALCQECADKFNPPICTECAKAYSKDIKWSMIKNIALSIIFMIIGIVVIESPAGILLAGIPYGWSILNKMTPSMFLWLSWIGWIVYFAIKLVLAYTIGLIALPIMLFKWILEIVKVNKILRNVQD